MSKYIGAMDLGVSEKVAGLREKIAKIIEEDATPLSEEFLEEVNIGDRWTHTKRQSEILDFLKNKAKSQGLWNFWLTDSERGYGLTTVDYAHLAEEMGKCHLGAETFNCSAPDTGNMEVIERYGTDTHKKQWLEQLLNGKIRSAYLMTEPDVASSDATNISMSCVSDGDEYVLNGEKYWASGAGDPRCSIYIVMVKTGGDDAPKHKRHSMVLVPADSKGIEILRPMKIFGHDDAPHGHMHLRFSDVRIPAENLLVGEGEGFAISQGRLGPGRIHHCMRSIGQAEKALELLCKRSVQREAFGKPLAQLGANFDVIAEARIEIDMARLLCLRAAWMMDQGDPRAAAPYISQIKVVAPRMALKVMDEAMQMHGGVGISQDTPLADMWMNQRTLRFADGPDAVHRRQIARKELKAYTQQKMG
jgi:acyl-CoA dehydrogenase